MAGLIDPYCGECNVRFLSVQMQEVSEACSPVEDDMVDGDLGDGMRFRAAPSSTRKKSQSFAGLTDTLLSTTELLRCSSNPGPKAAETQQRARWKWTLPHSSKNTCDLPDPLL